MVTTSTVSLIAQIAREYAASASSCLFTPFLFLEFLSSVRAVLAIQYFFAFDQNEKAPLPNRCTYIITTTDSYFVVTPPPNLPYKHQLQSITMVTGIFNKQHSLRAMPSPTNQPNSKENITEGMKRLGNYIRDETNKLSSSLDIYTAPNDPTHKQDDSWIEQQKKGAAKSITTSNNDGITEGSNYFEVLSGSEETDIVIYKGAPTSGNDVGLTASQAEDQDASSAAEKRKSPLRRNKRTTGLKCPTRPKMK
jgi:hypothetical protein